MPCGSRKKKRTKKVIVEYEGEKYRIDEDLLRTLKMKGGLGLKWLKEYRKAPFRAIFGLSTR